MTSPGSSHCCFASGRFLPAIRAKIFFLGSSDIPVMFFSCSLWDQDPTFRDLCQAALAKFGAEALKMLTPNKFHESRAAEDGESNPLEKKTMGVSGRRYTRRQDGVQDTDTHSVGVYVCVRGGWHPAGSYSHAAWSRIWALTTAVWSLRMPAGMSTRIVPDVWWDGRGTTTCCFLRDQMCFPPLPGR